MIGSFVGNYKITEKLGEGGMGSVFKGIDVMLERTVAIKALRPELARQPEIVERFRSEAITLAKLNHPRIATLYNFFRQGDDFFMVMEYVSGQTLESVISSEGAMSCNRALTIFCQALEGLDHAHSLGIVHRDIKPGNMMFTDSGSLKVMDFGIARVLGSGRMTKTGHLIGTIEYMSPEQVRGQSIDARADLYSMGILLYEMLTGRVPFIADSEYDLMRSQIEQQPPPPRSLSPGIPEHVEQAVIRALEKNPQDRFSTAAQFRTALMNDNSTWATNAASQPPSDLVPKETRIATHEPGIVIPAEIKGTRVAQLSDFNAAFTGSAGTVDDFAAPGNDQIAFVNDSQHRAATVDSQLSLFSRLNWKHYSGAALVLFLVAFGMIAAIFLGSSSTETTVSKESPVAEQPAARSTPTPVPAAQSSSGPIVGGPAESPGFVIPTQPVSDGGNKSESGKQTRSKRASKSTSTNEDAAARRARAIKALDK